MQKLLYLFFIDCTKAFAEARHEDLIELLGKFALFVLEGKQVNHIIQIIENGISQNCLLNEFIQHIWRGDHKRTKRPARIYYRRTQI